MRRLPLASNCTWILAPGGLCWDRRDRQTDSPPLAFPLQNQDGVCVQSVSVILHQDPRRQVTLTQAGDVLLFDQYRVTPPYTDGMALVDESWLGVGYPHFFFQAPLAKGSATRQELTFQYWVNQASTWSQKHGLWTCKCSLSPHQQDSRLHSSMMASPTIRIRMEPFSIPTLTIHLLITYYPAWFHKGFMVARRKHI